MYEISKWEFKVFVPDHDRLATNNNLSVKKKRGTLLAHAGSTNKITHTPKVIEPIGVVFTFMTYCNGI
jgi:hypothetical protein